MIRRLSTAIILGALLAPLSLLADDSASKSGTMELGSKKLAPIQNIFPNAYGNIDFRHYFLHNEVDAKTNHVATKPYFQPRFNLGSKFFDGKLDSKFVFSVENYYGTKGDGSLVADRGSRLENEFTVFKNKYVDFMPYLYVQFPKTTDDERGPIKTEIGFDTTFTLPFHSSAGEIKPYFEYIVSTFVGSKPDPKDAVTLRDTNNRMINKNDKDGTDLDKTLSLSDTEKKSLGLKADDTGNYKVNPNGRTFYHQFFTGLSYKPSFAKGLEGKAETIHTAKFVPVMEFDRAAQEIRSRKTSSRINSQVYSPVYENSYRFTVKYAFDQTYSVSNEFTLADKVDGSRKYQNMVSMVAVLFN